MSKQITLLSLNLGSFPTLGIPPQVPLRGLRKGVLPELSQRKKSDTTYCHVCLTTGGPSSGLDVTRLKHNPDLTHLY